jgi:hypothetical protein
MMLALRHRNRIDKPMKKAILGIVLVVVIAIAGLLFYVLTNLDSLVKAAIEKYGSEATQTAVQVDRVQIKLTEGDGAIRGLTVANPAGFDLPHALSLGEIGLGVDLQSLQKEPYVINHITVRAPEIFAEVNNDKNINLNVLKNNLTAGQSAAPEQPAQPGAEPCMIIKRLTFEQGRIIARLTPLNKDYTLNLPSINMSNLGGDSGATPGELARQILQRLTDAAQDEIRKQGLGAEIAKIRGDIIEKFDAEKARLKDQADGQIEEQKEKAREKLKGLFQ